MKFTEAIEGYLMDIAAQGYSPATIRLYRSYLPRIANYLNDPEIETITLNDLKKTMEYLKTEYQPVRPSGAAKPISMSSADNYWKAIRSFFKWSSQVVGTERPDALLPRPKFKLPEVTAFTEAEVRRMVDHCTWTVEVHSANRRSYRRKRLTADRDKALILTLLDTGLRLGELCRLTVQDVNFENGEVLVAPHGSGQKTKPRLVYLGSAARRAVWVYLAKREDKQATSKLFQINRRTIQSLLWRLSERAQVNNVHPHKFRHTFAIWYLRNGGDIFTLQRLLGHSSLEMVRHYLDLVDADVAAAHRKASPADRWKL